MHFYRRKISGMFTESYANVVYEIFPGVNNRLREPGTANSGKLGSPASMVAKIWVDLR